jgi:hypothetical protein
MVQEYSSNKYNQMLKGWSLNIITNYAMIAYNISDIKLYPYLSGH